MCIPRIDNVSSVETERIFGSGSGKLPRPVLGVRWKQGKIWKKSVGSVEYGRTTERRRNRGFATTQPAVTSLSRVWLLGPRGKKRLAPWASCSEVVVVALPVVRVGLAAGAAAAVSACVAVLKTQAPSRSRMQPSNQATKQAPKQASRQERKQTRKA